MRGGDGAARRVGGADLVGRVRFLAGGAAGTLPSGRHIRFKKGSELPNLYVTMLNKLGVPVEAVGEGSTGRLPLEPLSV